MAWSRSLIEALERLYDVIKDNHIQDIPADIIMNNNYGRAINGINDILIELKEYIPETFRGVL